MTTPNSRNRLLSIAGFALVAAVLACGHDARADENAASPPVESPRVPSEVTDRPLWIEDALSIERFVPLSDDGRPMRTRYRSVLLSNIRDEDARSAAGVRVTSDCDRRLMAFLPATVEGLTFMDSRIPTAEELKRMVELPKLKYLKLGFSKGNAGVLSKLMDFPALEHLDLGGETDDIRSLAPVIGKMSSLRYLEISTRGLGDEDDSPLGMSAIKQMTGAGLTSLLINQECRWSPDEIRALTGFRKLEELRLAAHEKAFPWPFPNRKPADPDPASPDDIKAALLSLGGLKSLRRVSISGYREFNSAVATELVRSLPRLECNPAVNYHGTEELYQLHQCRNLTDARLYVYSAPETVDLARVFHRPAALRTLVLGGDGSADYSNVALLAGLERATLGWLSDSARAARVLEQLRHVPDVDLSLSEVVSVQQALAPLGRSQKLRRLTLNCSIDDAGLPSAISRLRKLQELHLRLLGPIEDSADADGLAASVAAVIAAISQLPNLQSLNLRFTSYATGPVPSPAPWHVFGRELSKLAASKSLRHLDLEGSHFANDAMTWISESALESLSLRGATGLTVSDMTAVVESKIPYLDLSGPQLPLTEGLIQRVVSGSKRRLVVLEGHVADRVKEIEPYRRPRCVVVIE